MPGTEITLHANYIYQLREYHIQLTLIETDINLTSITHAVNEYAKANPHSLKNLW